MFLLVRNTPFSFKNDIFAGVTVAFTGLAQIILYTSILGIDFRFGAIGFIVAALFSSIFGARLGLVSGTSNLFLFLLLPVFAKYGIEYLMLITVFVGIWQLIFRYFRLAKYIRMMPNAIILGSITGLLVLVFFELVGSFRVPLPNGVQHWIAITELYVVLAFTILMIVGFIYLPKAFKFLPSSLTLIIIAIGLYNGLKLPTMNWIEFMNLYDLAPFSFDYFLNFPNVPINFETLKIILPTSLLIALIGVVQSLFMLSFTDDLTNTRGKSNQEILSIGIANIITGVLGGLPSTAMPSQTMVNLNAGGKGRLSNAVIAILVLIFVFIYPFFLNKIPFYFFLMISGLIVAETFVRTTVFQFGKMSFWEAFVLVIVATITVVFGLFYAVIIGIIISSGIFSWENARRIRVRKRTDEEGIRYYEFYGPLFFASVPVFKKKFDIETDNDIVVFDFLETKVIDYQGAKALFDVIELYKNAGKTVRLKYISSDMKRLIHKEKIDVEIIDADEDPTYTMIIDELS